MFKRIEIQLTEPICNCNECDLAWGITQEKSLYLSCKTCKTALTIPRDKFIGCFSFDVGYPTTTKSPKKKIIGSDNNLIRGNFNGSKVNTNK